VQSRQHPLEMSLLKCILPTATTYSWTSLVV
jgi:hypothetical protein